MNRNSGEFQQQPRTPWSQRIILATIVVAGLAFGINYMIGASSTEQLGPTLTHKVKRGKLRVSVIEQGTLESSDNTEIICRVRGENTVNWVIESGTMVKEGEDLLRLDTLYIDEQINERSKYAHWSRSGAEGSKAWMERATLAIPEYEEGRYQAELLTMEKDLAIAKSRLRTAEARLEFSKLMAQRGYVSDLEIERNESAVTASTFDVEVKMTNIDVLKKYTRAEELNRLQGELAKATAQFGANDERKDADASRRDRAIEEREYCVLTAPKDGLVIHPSAARWKNAPEITEGGTVYKDQVLLLMPDLTKMQVKVGVHESIVDRVEPGQRAIVTLPGQVLEGKVAEVAEVTRPAGWWTGNVVKYDTIVELPNVPGLKPGMSAEVEIILTEQANTLMVPVAAIVETEAEHLCWIQSGKETKRRVLKLGESNDAFVEVLQGLQENDQVVLNPLSLIPEAQEAAIKTVDQANERDARETEERAENQKVEADKKPAAEASSKPANKKPQADDEKSS